MSVRSPACTQHTGDVPEKCKENYIRRSRYLADIRKFADIGLNHEFADSSLPEPNLEAVSFVSIGTMMDVITTVRAICAVAAST